MDNARKQAVVITITYLRSALNLFTLFKQKQMHVFRLKSLLSQHKVGMTERVIFFSAVNKTKLAGEEKIDLKRNLLVERNKRKFN